jgi:hypothetical protein
LDHQHPTGVVQDHGGDSDDEAVRWRSGRIVIVVAFGHGF